MKKDFGGKCVRKQMTGDETIKEFYDILERFQLNAHGTMAVQGTVRRRRIAWLDTYWFVKGN